MNPLSKKKILVADDEQSIRSLVTRFLSNKYTVLEAEDGEEAIEISRSQKPDLILLDIMMPKMDGYTACHTLKRDSITKAVPVVMLTGLGYALNMKLSQDRGADGYITKPFTTKDLLDTIGQLLTSPG
jgi:two-component system phosphate regulon response regulator PhoB